MKTGKGNNPIRQHHVPRVYLKYFCAPDKSISVLDTKTGKIFTTGIEAAGVENNFYTLTGAEDPFCWEKSYAQSIEPLISKVLPQIIAPANIMAHDEQYVITEEEKAELATIMIVQLLRGKQSREYERELFHKLIPEVIEETQKRFEELSSSQLKMLQSLEQNETLFRALAMEVSLDPKRIICYSQELCKRTFIVFRCAMKGVEFVTSDNPVMFINSETADATPYTNGIIYPKTLLYFPLSPYLILAAYHPNSFFGKLQSYDRKLIDLRGDRNRSFIKTINRKQMEQCYGQVYSKKSVILQKLKTS